MAYPLTYVSPFTAIAANALNAEDAVALMEDFIPWWAIIPAALSGFSLPRRIGRLSIFGIDATDGVAHGGTTRPSPVRSVQRLVCSLMWAAGLRAAALVQKVLLHLYESQPWEKMLAVGVRRYLPSTRVGGSARAVRVELSQFFSQSPDIEEGALARHAADRRGGLYGMVS